MLILFSTLMAPLFTMSVGPTVWVGRGGLGHSHIWFTSGSHLVLFHVTSLHNGLS